MIRVIRLYRHDFWRKSVAKFVSQEQEEVNEHERKRVQATVRPSKLLRHPLAASIALSRELGQLSTRLLRETVIKSTWGLGVSCISFLDFGDRIEEGLRTSAFLESINGEITTLLKDKASGTVIAGGLREPNARLGQLV